MPPTDLTPAPAAELSVVLVAGTGAPGIARTMQHLRAQTARRRLEVVIVAESSAGFDLGTLGGDEFAICRIVEVGDAAAVLYERLALRHTESREAGVAEMALGKHALSEGRALKAVQWFEAYQRREGGELAAEAIWGEARALQSLGEAERARELWTRLIEQYPASAYAAAAREQLGP